MKTTFSLSSFLMGAVIGAALTSAWFLGTTYPMMSISSLFPSEESLSTTTVPSQSSAVSVATQPAGDAVIVQSVTVPSPGVWVAVRELTGGMVGNVLGAARVGGPRTDVIIPLLRATQPGSTYAIELYRDDSNTPDFDLTADSVYVDFSTDQPVIVDFTTTN